MSTYSDTEGNLHQIAQTKKMLKKLLNQLQDMNSRFPATREFLKLRGLDSVSQLDTDGLIELQDHLQGVYKRLLN